MPIYTMSFSSTRRRVEILETCARELKCDLYQPTCHTDSFPFSTRTCFFHHPYLYLVGMQRKFTNQHKKNSNPNQLKVGKRHLRLHKTSESKTFRLALKSVNNNTRHIEFLITRQLQFLAKFITRKNSSSPIPYFSSPSHFHSHEP